MVQTGPQVGGDWTTQAQTLGELSNTAPFTQATVCTQPQMPPQSAPPALGSQSSLGSSAHLPPPGQGVPANPPQRTTSASGTQAATGGQGARTHWTSSATQWLPASHSTVA